MRNWTATNNHQSSMPTHRGLFLLPNVKILTPCQFSPEIFWRFHFFFLPLPPLTNMIVYLFSRATVFAYGFIAAGFFYADRLSFSRWWGNGIPKIHGGCMNRKHLNVLWIVIVFVSKRGMQPPPFSPEIKCELLTLTNTMQYAKYIEFGCSAGETCGHQPGGGIGYPQV